MQPRSEGPQRCLNFALTTSPGLARDVLPGSTTATPSIISTSRAATALLTVTMDALVATYAP